MNTQIHSVYINCLFVLFAAVFALQCTRTNADKLVDSWLVGTYTGLMDDFSQEEFHAFREAGIAYLELSINPLMSMSEQERVEWIAEFRDKTKAAGLEVWSVHMPWSNTLDISTNNEEHRLHTIETHIRTMEMLEPLNIQKYVMHPSAEPIADEDRPQRLRNAIASLNVLAKESENFSGTIAIEVMPRTLLANTSDEILYMISQVEGPLEICFDTNHVLQEKPEEFVRRVGDLITTVHASDYDGLDEKHWLPGKGSINWNNVIDELVHIGFEGPWMFEVVPRADDDPILTADVLVENWQMLKTAYNRR